MHSTHVKSPAILALALAFSPFTSAFSQSSPPSGSAAVSPVSRKTQKDTDISPVRNFLVLVGDDLGVDMVGAYGVGTDRPPTPNLDALAARGVLFANAWSNPVCSPTRATLQTGRYSLRTGIGMGVPCLTTPYGLPDKEVTLAEMLQFSSAGAYATAAIGKWHLSTNLGQDLRLAPNDQGYDHYEGHLCGEVGDYYHWLKTTNGQNSLVNEYVTTHNTNAALEWISGATEPWLCYVSYNNPHTPFHAPPQHLHTSDLSGEPPPSASPRPYYKAQVEAMDTEIGRLLAGLGPKLGRTNIFFVGDNGTPGPVIRPPFTALQGKGTLYQGGIHVPLIVTGPDVKRRGTCEALVGTVDLFATLAEIAGVKVDELPIPDRTLDSVSMVPYLKDPATATIRKTILSETFGQNGADTGLRTCPVGMNVCQPDIGYAGPGQSRLEVCGQPLYAQNQASLHLTGAPANAPALLFVAADFSPRPMFGGTVTPMSNFDPQILFTDANGEYAIPSLSLLEYYAYILFLNKKTVYLQTVTLDPTKPDRYSISNTVAVQLPGWNVKAVRGERYKLIADVTGGPVEFFDLQADPFERNNLLLGSLSQTELDRFHALWTEINSYLDPTLPGACVPN